MLDPTLPSWFRMQGLRFWGPGLSGVLLLLVGFGFNPTP